MSDYRSSLDSNIDKYIDLISWCRWNPDLWYDMITPETGGMILDLDQRVFLRSITRFISTYGVFPRGYGKTLKEVMGMIHTAIFFPLIEIAMTAQTQQNASSLVEEKWKELTRFYPLLLNEVEGKPSFTKDSAEINFKSGGRIDVLANAQSSKGQRRKRLQIEESALLNNELFQDCIEPIPNVPRRTIGKNALINPEELNGQINFFTTSGWRGTDEYERNLMMIKEMAELKGKIVLGSDWQLAVHYGRGEPKAALLDKKSRLSPTFFAQNYESKWVGTVDGSIVDIKQLLNLRVLECAEFKNDGKHEYILSVDVARSHKKNNNQTSIAVLKLIRTPKGRLKNIHLVNLINLRNGLTFGAQAIEVKRIRRRYSATIVVIDGNGVGSGLLDELIKDAEDPSTKENLGCWDTINTDHEAEIKNAEKVIYNFVSQASNHDGIVSIQDMVISGTLQLLIKDTNIKYDDTNYAEEIYPFVQTDRLIEEIANLKVVTQNNGKLTVQQLTKRIDKDRYSALMMGIWYIKNFLNKVIEEKEINIKNFSLTRKPKIYGKRKGASF
ncbi:Terminase-like family [Paenibacillus sophorae]|uniref:Terminase-like family n=1 Tax=Paenibacillus sophorae TaxID=1333845 RepID=A0A1H8JK43_9BACL|nr:hypothetical protein [Paenibacillus sophorae]QWU13391.1 hypothetical protein KP014_15430 [Paenibacillus sophorae]SEN81154.1 Terminase-like family [Paenibacillus sophorae]